MEIAINLPEESPTKFKIKRFPKTLNHTLKPWSTADEFILSTVIDHKLETKNIGVYNDSFGYLATHLNTENTLSICSSKSQEKALENNMVSFCENDSISRIYNIFSDLPNQLDVALLKVPKSLDLFELYLNTISHNLNKDGLVICAFMTKHFTKQLLTIAEKYFKVSTQSKAWKKSRLLVLSEPIQDNNNTSLPIQTIKSKWGQFKQYNGVFSAKNIDYASQFLIDNISIPAGSKKILDLASGNGILAKIIQDKDNSLEINLIDDSILAIESSKLNIKGDSVNFHHHYNLDVFSENEFDYIITNPPFHIEYEIDINLPLGLFEQAYFCLKPNGVLQIVSNNHLNYETHLVKYFNSVMISAKNDKFIVYTCIK